jgi:DNA-binding transcriptional LysR family regulator
MRKQVYSEIALPTNPVTIRRRFVLSDAIGRATRPDASVRVETLSSREIARRLADFEIDAGLTYLDNETPPGSRCVELYRERHVLLAPAANPLMNQREIRWSDAAKLRLCLLTTAMRNRRIDSNMAAEGSQCRPVVEATSVDALFAHLTGTQLATIASASWLPGLEVPPGLACARWCSTVSVQPLA